MSTRTLKQDFPNFTVYEVDSTYYAKDNFANTILYDDTALEVVINAAIANLTTGQGRVYLALEGSHSIADDIIMDRFTALEGQGVYNTRLQASGNMTDAMINLADSSSGGSGWAVKNLMLDLNGNDGHGIGGEDFCCNSSWALHELENLYIFDVQATFAGLSIGQPFHINSKNVMITTEGTGMHLYGNLGAAVHVGNSTFTNTMIKLMGNDSTCIKLEGADGSNKVVLVHFEGHTWPYSNSAAFTGTLGVDIDYANWNVFNGLDIELMTNGIDINNASLGNTFNDPYIDAGKNAGAYGVRIHDGCYDNKIIKGRSDCGGEIAYSDEVTTAWVYASAGACFNLVEDHWFNDASDTIVTGLNTRMKGCQLGNRLALVANPFKAAAIQVDGLAAKYGILRDGADVAAPVSGRQYYALNTDYLIRVSGGTVSTIETYDRAGNLIGSHGATVEHLHLPFGCVFEVTWTVEPTVEVWTVSD